jgi:hypothetical protein
VCVAACAARRGAVGAAGAGWTARVAVCAAVREAMVVCAEGAGWRACVVACAATREAVGAVGAGWTARVAACAAMREAMVV